MNKKMMQRGDIFLANLDPVFGNEQGGYCLVLVLQDDSNEQYRPTTIVAPIVDQSQSRRNNHVVIGNEPKNSPVRSALVLDQIRCIDKVRLGAYKGSIGKQKLQAINKALLLTLGLQDEMMPVEVTLCFNCMKSFLGAGHRVVRVNPNQEIKDRCMYCNTRRGFDYYVF